MFRNFIYLNNVLPVFENSLCVLCECKLSISEYHQTFTWKHGCKDKHLCIFKTLSQRQSEIKITVLCSKKAYHQMYDSLVKKKNNFS